MTINSQYIKKLIRHGLIAGFRVILSRSPNFLSVIFGRAGFTEVIKRSPSVNFVGSVYETNFKIYCQGNYAVERVAVARKMTSSEPFLGIKSLGLKNFTMLDIGANVGTYTVAAAGIGAKRVFAVEPGPLFDRLAANIRLNNLGEVITPIKIGLSSNTGKMRWYEDLQNPGNAHLVISKDCLSFEKIPTKFGDVFFDVDVIELDKLAEMQSFGKIDLIKIDVEGMEWDVLRSGKVLIENNLPIIVAETHRVSSDMMKYDCMTPLFTYLYALNYGSYSFINGEFKKFIYPNFDLDTFFIHEQFQFIQ